MKAIFTKIKYITLVLLIFLFMLALIFDPKIYMDSLLKGILLWANAVLPALFPFFFFSGLLIKLKAVDSLGNKFSKFTQKMFHCPGCSGIIYLLSIISGYPVGAKVTAEMYQNGAISKDQATRINAFASTSGPLFIVGSVGVGMFFNHTCGLIMLFSHYIGALINGVLYRNYNYKKEKLNTVYNLKVKTQDILSNTMYDSILSILLVGGYIAIFFVIIDILTNSGALGLVSNSLHCILNFLNLPTEISTGITSGFFEMTKGCLDLSQSSKNLNIIAPLACAIISWSGISIHLQALTFLNKCGIKKSIYFLQKFTQCIISGIICYLLILIFL